MSSSSLTPDSGSELSELSDVESAELEKKLFANKAKSSLDSWLHGGTDGTSSPPPPKRKREPSPPHDYILADNPDIAFIVMFRARFSSSFPRFLSNFGPQDLENAVVGSPPGELAEKLLCALLALVLNRKKDIAVGSYNKALEEAISENRHQWPRSWQKNPMTGGTNFHTMSPEQRLDFFKALCLWALNTSEAIQTTIRDSYKQNRHDDDLNQPLSVQAWGRDGDKRRYWLVEGQEDTFFRLYRENNPALKTNTWWSVAGDIPEIRAFAAKLLEEGSQAAKRLADRIHSAIPRFEGGEDKRKRREYRLNRKMQFRRPDPGFSLYEGRTRGKRLKYTYSDNEDGFSDAYSARRSTRNATPAEPAGPIITASGRQVRSRLGGAYGETLHSGRDGVTPGFDTDGDVGDSRTRSGRVSNGHSRKSAGYASDEESDAVSSANEWQGNDDEDDADDETDGDVEMENDDELEDKEEGSKSLVVKLKVSQGQSDPPDQTDGLDKAPNGSKTDGMPEPHGSLNSDEGRSNESPSLPQSTPLVAGTSKPGFNVPQVQTGHSDPNSSKPYAPPVTVTNGTATKGPVPSLSAATHTTSQADSVPMVNGEPRVPVEQSATSHHVSNGDFKPAQAGPEVTMIG